MINKVEFTVKGDYTEMTLSRSEGSRWIEMAYHYPKGASFARFELKDLEKALAILKEADNEPC